MKERPVTETRRGDAISKRELNRHEKTMRAFAALIGEHKRPTSQPK